MTTVISSLPDLSEAITKANKIIFEQEYIVAVANKEIHPKEPVFLQLKYPDGRIKDIGIIHLVHLKGKDWDDKPFEAIARTTDQVVKAIIDRMELFFDAGKQRFYIDESGTIFNFNNIPIKLNEDKTFSIGTKVVTYGEKSLPLKSIKSEGVIKFMQLENGHIQLFDLSDQRQGKGIFIDQESRIYRG